MEPEEIHSTHNMRRFSDIPWGCWSCGACDCHHQEVLKKRCERGAKDKNMFTNLVPAGPDRFA